MKTFWFRRKRYGWGWFPVTWQGWAVTLGYAGFVTVSTIMFGSAAHAGCDVCFFAMLAIATIILIIIGYKTGEPLKWHWGSDDDKDQ